MYNSRNAYYRCKLDNCSSPADYWRQLRLLGLIKAKSERKPLLFSSNDLNDYFSNVTAHGTPVNEILPHLHETPDVNLDRFYFSHITSFLKAFYLSKSTSVGHDLITWNILEASFPLTVTIIVDILNHSLMNSTFPSIWKKSVIVPLPKKKNPTDLNDLRPIALLPVLSKVLELIVHNQLMAYCDDKNLLDVCQTEYKRGHSTQTALLNVIDDIKLLTNAKSLYSFSSISAKRSIWLIMGYYSIK